MTGRSGTWPGSWIAACAAAFALLHAGAGLAEGLAQVKGVTSALPDGTPSRDYLKRLRALENQARVERKGAWARSSK